MQKFFFSALNSFFSFLKHERRNNKNDDNTNNNNNNNYQIDSFCSKGDEVEKDAEGGGRSQLGHSRLVSLAFFLFLPLLLIVSQTQLFDRAEHHVNTCKFFSICLLSLRQDFFSFPLPSLFPLFLFLVHRLLRSYCHSPIPWINVSLTRFKDWKGSTCMTINRNSFDRFKKRKKKFFIIEFFYKRNKMKFLHSIQFEYLIMSKLLKLIYIVKLIYNIINIIIN